MIHEVRTTPYGAPADEVLAAVVGAAKAGDPLAPVTVVVPTNGAGLSVRRRLARQGVAGRPGGIANVSFVTPFQLVELLAPPALLASRPLTNPLLGAAVRAALRSDPGPFAAVAEHEATEAALVALYADLRTLDDATLARVEAGGAGPAVRTFRAIRARLGGVHDETDLARAVATDLPAERAAVLGHVVWYLPQPTTAPLVAALAAVLAAVPATVVVGCTGDEEADAAVWATCARAGVVRPADGPAQARPVAARIVSATDADEEVRAVVRSIAGLLEEGVRADGIAVFYPVADPYLSLLAAHLDEAGIPSNGPDARRLADSVAGRTLLAALALPAQQWRRDRLLALVAGAPVRAGHGTAHPAAWEELSRAAGVVAGLDDWSVRLARHGADLDRAAQDADQAGEADRVERIKRDRAQVDVLARFVADLAERVSAVADAATWTAKVAAASSLLRALVGTSDQAGSWPEDEVATFARVEDVLVRLAALDEAEPHPSQAVFERALAAELAVPRGRTGRFGQGVLLAPLTAAVGLTLDAVFLVGANEGLCPSARRDDALLPDAARLLTDGALLPRADRHHQQHRSFLAALATAPPAARTLTTSRGDLRTSATRLPSRWLLDSASALAGESVRMTDLVEGSTRTVEQVEVLASHASALVGAPVAASLAERDRAALARHVAGGGVVEGHPVAALVARGLGAQAARRSPAFTEWDGNVAGQPIESSHERPLSATRLEAWASCGFRYLLAHVLGLGRREDPERVVELSARDRGSLLHLVLERFVDEAIDAGPPDPEVAWSEEDHQRIEALAHEAFAETEAQGLAGRRVRWDLVQADLLRLLHDVLKADDQHRRAHGARPERVELAFGLAGEPPVVLTLPDGRTLHFRGLVDRVDRAADGTVLVTDYKSGRSSSYKGLEEDPVLGGTTLQLGLYAEAVRQHLGAGEVEAHYWCLGEQKLDGPRSGYRWTDERRQRFLEVVGTIAAGIEAGAFPLAPGEYDSWRGTHSACRYCDFDAVCPADRGEQAEVKVDAPALAPRRALQVEAAS